MRSRKDLLLATKPYAKDKPAQSWWALASTFLLLLLAAVGAFQEGPLWWRGLCSVGVGLLLLRLFVIYHDHQHLAILRGSWLANWLMTGFGLLALSPSSIWRSSHTHHHNHNSRMRGSHIGSFPVMTRQQFEGCSRGRQLKYLFMRHPLTILFGYVFIFLFGMCVYPFVNGPWRHIDSLVALLLHIAIGAALFAFAGWQGWLFVQLVPHFIASAIGSYLFYAQHNFPAVKFHDNAGWTYEGAALESSSFMKMSALMNWFTANIGYHHIHHLNARIPFHRLPEVMAAFEELQNPKVTSLTPLEIWRCLRLKVWDVEAQKMVPLK